MDDSSDNPELNPEKRKEFLETALSRFKLVCDAEADMRQAALEADKFSTGDQWPDTIRTGRETGPNPRPCLTIDKTDPAVRQVANEARQNRPQTHVIPFSDGTKETADILEGMVRFIQVDSNSDVAVDTGFDQMLRGGWGYMRLVTEYCDDETFNQDIKIKTVKNRFSVYNDPYIQEPDGSDSRFCFITDDMPNDEFKQAYPKSELNNISDFSTLGDNAQGWKDSKTTRIAEYWVKEETPSKLHELEDGTVIPAEQYDKLKDMPLAVPVPPIKRSRDVMKSKIACYKITAVDILEKSEWAGKYIPIIPIIGEDHIIDGKRKIRGMVTQMMDPQRIYNYMSSASVEAIALAPKAPWLITAGQIEGFENLWAISNTANLSHLPYNATETVTGTLHPAPTRIQAEPPIQAMTYAIQQASMDMQSTSGQFDPSLGKSTGQQSGRAINSLQRQGSISTYHFTDNLSRALRFLGVQLLDLIPHIYDVYRIVSIVKPDDTHEKVEINQHMKPGITPEDMEGVFDVTKRRYSCLVTTGPSFGTKRQESAEAMLSISQAYPPLWEKAGDLMVKAQDWPLASELADRLRPPGMEEGKQKIPPEAQQQMQQMGMMIEQMTAALNDAQDKLEGKESEIASKEKIAAMNNETKIAVTAMQTEMANAFGLLREELAHLRHTQTRADAQAIAAQQPEPQNPPA